MPTQLELYAQEAVKEARKLWAVEGGASIVTFFLKYVGDKLTIFARVLVEVNGLGLFKAEFPCNSLAAGQIAAATQLDFYRGLYRSQRGLNEVTP